MLFYTSYPLCLFLDLSLTPSNFFPVLETLTRRNSQDDLIWPSIYYRPLLFNRKITVLTVIIKNWFRVYPRSS